MTIKILGSGAATPCLGRHQSSILLNVDTNLFLFDCGEGTQMQMLLYKVKFGKINHIFISHLHGDHYLGLIGLLSSINSWGRKNPLYLYAPQGLREILTIQFRYQDTRLNYQLIMHEVQTTKVYCVFENDKIQITTLPLQHRIACAGYLVKEKPKLRNIIKHKLTQNITLQQIQQLKLGNDVVDERNKVLYKCDEYTYPAEPTKSFAYCSDTKYDWELVPLIKNTNLLYHEATFLDDHIKRAKETFHSTATQAATIAKMANVEKLLIGHFSARYSETEPFLLQAGAVFQNVLWAEEGKEFEV